MLLIAENENQKLKQQLASTQAGDLENISSENAKLSSLNSRYSAEIEELKLAKLELDEQTTKQKYQIENFEAENRRLKAEHKELTEERRRLVDDRAKLAEEFEQKIKIISEFEKSNETNENELEQLNSRFSELEAENSNLLEKLEEAEQVNKRLREGNLKVQDHEVGFQIRDVKSYAPQKHIKLLAVKMSRRHRPFDIFLRRVRLYKSNSMSGQLIRTFENL